MTEHSLNSGTYLCS